MTLWMGSEVSKGAIFSQLAHGWIAMVRHHNGHRAVDGNDHERELSLNAP